MCKAIDNSNGEVEPIDSWEEEDEAEPEVGDGGDGGGIVLQNCTWGERALSIAQEVLLDFGEDFNLYAFKTSPRGYIYVRLDKLSNEQVFFPIIELRFFEFSSFTCSEKYVLSIVRFKEMPMVVSYIEDSSSNTKYPEKSGVYFLDSIETESRCCVWKLADVRENRDPSAKGRPLSRKQKDSRLKLPYNTIKRVTLYISY
ncbi:hypothetical protein ACP275_12G092700 [Erythranthe tilingii]